MGFLTCSLYLFQTKSESLSHHSIDIEKQNIQNYDYLWNIVKIYKMYISNEDNQTIRVWRYIIPIIKCHFIVLSFAGIINLLL